MQQHQKINFLPYREMQKTDKKSYFQRIMFSAFIAGLLGVFLLGYVLDYKTKNQASRNNFLQKEIIKLEGQLVEVKQLKQEIQALEIQRDTVYALQNNRTHAVELMEMFTRRTPEEVYLTSVKQEDILFTIQGVASSNERVSQLMRNLEQVQWVRKVNLLQTKLSKIEEISPTGIKTQRTLYEFSISFERFIENNINPSIAPVNDLSINSNNVSSTTTQTP